MATPSLHARANCQPAAPLLLVAAAVCLGLGLWLPALETKRLVVSLSSYSILESIGSLYSDGHWPIATLVLAFSVVFPLVKLVGLGLAWFAPLEPGRRARLLRVVDRLGKWSMLDVLVVAVLLGTLNLGFPSGAKPRAGVYVFAVAVLLSMAAARGIMRDAGAVEPPRRHRTDRAGALGLLLALASLACIVLGLERIALSTSKWQLWEVDYSVVGGLFELRADDPVLGLLLVLFVVVLPLVGLLAGLFTASRALLSGRALPARWVALERWSMVDVFVLALLVVATKLSDVLTVQRGQGLWWLAAGALLAQGFRFAALERRPGSLARRPGTGRS